MAIIKKLKDQIIKYLNSKGYDLIKKFKYNGETQYKIDGLDYGTIYTNSFYSPWLGDRDFQNIYNIIKENTLVDIFRCYELWQLVEEVNKVNPIASILE